MREIYHKGFPDLQATDDYIDFLCNISENIERIRKQKGLTTKNMSELGFEHRFYQRLESGTRSMNLRTLFKLSRIFNVSIQEFFRINQKLEFKKWGEKPTFEEIKEVLDHNKKVRQSKDIP